MNGDIIARALGGHRSGDGWMASCPAHDDHDPSLSIKETPDGKILVHCHAGCKQPQVIAELRSRGLWHDSGNTLCRCTYQHQKPTPKITPTEERTERTTAALRLWQSAAPASGSPAETYLRSRGIQIATPSTIRFHARLKHPDRHTWPGLVALVTQGTDGHPLAVHRTFLSHDGSCKAPVTPQKMMLGPCRGGVVRLAVADHRLMIGEGIETCLSAMQATGVPAWAAMSASGLRTLVLPKTIQEVIILADGDQTGETAALDAGRRWKREGRTVRIARPPRGMDFNDLLFNQKNLWQEGTS